MRTKRKASQQTPLHESTSTDKSALREDLKEAAKHLRSINFSYIAISFAIVLASFLVSKPDVDRASKQLSEVDNFCAWLNVQRNSFEEIVDYNDGVDIGFLLEIEQSSELNNQVGTFWVGTNRIITKKQFEYMENKLRILQNDANFQRHRLWDDYSYRESYRLLKNKQRNYNDIKLKYIFDFWNDLVKGLDCLRVVEFGEKAFGSTVFRDSSKKPINKELSVTRVARSSDASQTIDGSTQAFVKNRKNQFVELNDNLAKISGYTHGLIIEEISSTKWKYTYKNDEIEKTSVILPVRTEPRTFYFSSWLIEKAPSQFSHWKNTSSDSIFPDLAQIVKQHPQMSVAECSALIEVMTDNSDGRFQFLGTSIPHDVLAKYGVLLIFIVQGYFWIQLRHFCQMGREVTGRIEYPWIPLFEDPVSKVISVVTVVVIPVGATFVVMLGDELGLAKFYYQMISLLLAAVILFELFRLWAVMHGSCVWSLIRAKTSAESRQIKKKRDS